MTDLRKTKFDGQVPVTLDGKVIGLAKMEPIGGDHIAHVVMKPEYQYILKQDLGGFSIGSLPPKEDEGQ